MQTRTVYTDEQFPNVELWEHPDGLQIKNGKIGRPHMINCEHYASAAAGFFKALAYLSDK